MADATHCVRCGTEVDGLSAEGICPACLLKLGLPGDQSDEALTVTAPGEAPSTDRHVDSRLTPGQTFGSYRIERLLGKGGMGEVYEAEEIESGRRVALKLLTHGLDEVNRDRFLREGRLAASVTHPNTIYVFGTDEIEGIPVIAMELAAGGTLKDKLKAEGPLPPAEAVDVVLQAVAGLAAAADAGVLHRDIKPSNCFVDQDGTVKVGDFGLSISTLARADTETQLTTTGSVLGTPAFASPEQLRGDELDIRSDIYAVGATLYYLLTGRAPFDEANLLRLVSIVAQEPPASPRTLRKSVPKGLAALTLRCLAKKPRSRPGTYETLTSALRPYESSAPTPATLGFRALASVVDDLLTTALILSFVPSFFVEATGIRFDPWFLLVSFAVPVLYFAILEGAWGASIGKWVCGLRVIGPENQPPGFARALGRVVVFDLGGMLPTAAPVLIWTPEEYAAFSQTGLGQLFDLLPIALLAIFFSTARRRNGFAGIHELATATRVVTRSTAQPRAAALPLPEEASPLPTGRRVGPYKILGDPFLHDSTRAVGYDEKLRRNVWIRQGVVGDPPIPPNRRDLARFTRLRWLGGKRTGEESWDVYEAPAGRSLASLVTEPVEWRIVRHWLADLAVELHAGLRDHSLPELDLDRVWVTPDGHARLLDWPAPGVERCSQPGGVDTPRDLDSAQRFLHRVGRAALTGRADAAEDEGATGLSPLPLPARTLIERLGTRTFQTPDVLVGSVVSAVQRPAFVSRWRRSAHLALCAALPMLLLLSVLAFPLLLETSPEAGDFMSLTALAEETNDRPPQWADSNLHPSERTLLTSRATRSLLEDIVALHPNPSDLAIRDAISKVEPYLELQRAARALASRTTGLHVQTLPGQEAGDDGVPVVRVEGESFLAATGLQADDVITSVDRRAVEDIADPPVPIICETTSLMRLV